MEQPLNFENWIEQNRESLKPPVGNKCIWPDREFIVMMVGGPNSRTDFHVNAGEEYFQQMQGDMHLVVINPQGKMEKIKIREGEIYLLPANTPHSPQRGPGTLGLVIERRRRVGELDALQWYCEKCTHKLYEERFQLTNIETQFPAVFERYYGSDHVNCRQCGHKNGRTWSLSEN